MNDLQMRKLMQMASEGFLFECPEWIPVDGTHGHMTIIPFSKDQPILASEYEFLAEELAEAVRLCDYGRHNGHGQLHTHDEVMEAFRVGAEQLATRRHGLEFMQVLDRYRTHKMWGSHMPAGVIFPAQDDPDEWKLVVPNKRGEPVFYDVKDGVMEDIIPPPTDSSVKAVPDKAGVGFIQPKRRRKK